VDRHLSRNVIALPLESYRTKPISLNPPFMASRAAPDRARALSDVASVTHLRTSSSDLRTRSSNLHFVVIRVTRDGILLEVGSPEETLPDYNWATPLPACYSCHPDNRSDIGEAY